MGEPITATIPIGQDRLDSHDSAAVALASAPRSISGAASGPRAVSTADDAQISNSEVVLALVKCAIGAGSLSLPYAFKEGGLWFSLIGTVLIGMLSAYTIILLKQVSEIETTTPPIYTYSLPTRHNHAPRTHRPPSPLSTPMSTPTSTPPPRCTPPNLKSCSARKRWASSF
mmetsp:Transcript_63530/g.175160  ORF Transcript_63530/g.175160 Transcript_63530/m.175160 type:complete len:171 (-) Transcript_63530:1363-1875(-)